MSKRRGTGFKTIDEMIASRRAAEQRQASRIKRLIDRGPPTGSYIVPENWRQWYLYGFFACPRTNYTCADPGCHLGAACIQMWTIGLWGNGSTRPVKDRPKCGARNRKGTPCEVRVEPGRERCRFHGGLSTGPRTPEGRARNRRIDIIFVSPKERV